MKHSRAVIAVIVVVAVLAVAALPSASAKTTGFSTSVTIVSAEGKVQKVQSSFNLADVVACGPGLQPVDLYNSTSQGSGSLRVGASYTSGGAYGVYLVTVSETAYLDGSQIASSRPAPTLFVDSVSEQAAVSLDVKGSQLKSLMGPHSLKFVLGGTVISIGKGTSRTQTFSQTIASISLSNSESSCATETGVTQANQTSSLVITQGGNNVTTYQFSSTAALTSSFATQTIVTSATSSIGTSTTSSIVTSTTSSLVVSCPSGTVYDGSGCVSEQPITAPVSVTLTIKLACPTGDTLHQYHFGELYNCATPSGAYVPLIDAPLPSGTPVTAALYAGYTSNIVIMPSVTPASQTSSTDASGTVLLKFSSVTVGSGYSPALGTDVQLSPTIGLAFSLNGTSYGGSNLISFQFPLPIQSSYTATLTVTPGGQLGA